MMATERPLPRMTDEAAAELRKPFPKGAIGKLPKAGVQLDYVGHAAVTDRLLAVDPEWTWEPMATDADGLPLPDGQGNLWIRLTVCGVTRIGVGDGPSAKVRIGDALRNAAMRFGVALDLWSKEELEQGHQAPEPAPRAPTVVPRDPDYVERGPLLLNTTSKLAKAMYAGLNKEFGTDAERSKAFISEVVGREIASTKELTEAEARQVLDHLPAAVAS